MRKTATFDLILHGGKAPPWLVSRMKKLGKAILRIIIEEYGRVELLRRLSDPLWFQALSYVLGYDWNSSGVTTVMTGVLREILTPDMGIMLAGGKGKRSLQTPEDIRRIGEIFGFSESKINELIKASRLVAKVDNAVLQDGYSLYHHAMLIDRDGLWAVIQQGMNVENKTARRYHWLSEKVKSFVIEPHEGIIGEIKLPFVLDMTSKRSLEAQKISVDLVNEGLSRIKNDIAKLIRISKGIPSLMSFVDRSAEEKRLLPSIKIKILRNIRVDWNALKKAYELSPKDYQELISIKGIGPGTIRALALIAELIYRAEVSWRDPLRYTFAVGGKDRVPYPVNIKRMEILSGILEDALREAKLGRKEKLMVLRRLSRLLS